MRKPQWMKTAMCPWKLPQTRTKYLGINFFLANGGGPLPLRFLALQSISFSAHARWSGTI